MRTAIRSPEEVSVLDQRLNEQAAGETEHGVGSLVRGDEGFGAKPSREQRVSRLLWNP